MRDEARPSGLSIFQNVSVSAFHNVSKFADLIKRNRPVIAHRPAKKRATNRKADYLLFFAAFLRRFAFFFGFGAAMAIGAAFFTVRFLAFLRRFGAAFLAVLFLAVRFFVVRFFAVDFLAGRFLAAFLRFGAAFFAVAFFFVAFLAVRFLAVAFLRFGAAFFAVAFFFGAAFFFAGVILPSPCTVLRVGTRSGTNS